MDHLHGAIKYVGLDIFFQLIQNILLENDVPIISVGSGNGVLEKHITNTIHKHVICVDPLVEDYNYPQYGMINPDYSIVAYLLIAQPELVGNCILLLNHASPNESTYDYDAVLQLQPLHILFCGEPSGTAGGQQFLKWYVTTRNKFSVSSTDTKYMDHPKIAYCSSYDEIAYVQGFEFDDIEAPPPLEHVQNIPQYVIRREHIVCKDDCLNNVQFHTISWLTRENIII